MIYPAYLLCLGLMVPAFALTALIVAMKLFAAGPRDGWTVVINFLAFFGAGIENPVRYGWRIVGFLGTIVMFIGAGAIPGLRNYAFHGLALLATLCVVFCFYAASQQDVHNVLNAFLVLSPSLVGIAACLWFATKFKG